MTTSPELALHDPSRFSDTGLLQVEGLLDPHEVDAVAQAFERQLDVDRAAAHDDGCASDDPLARYPRFVHPHRRTDLPIGRLTRRLLLDPRLWSVVEDLIGPAWGAQSMFYFKPPGGRGQAMHQDNAFLQARPETCLAAWIALDHVDADNGGLVVVPGSHTEELLCLEPADPSQSFASLGVAIPEGYAQVQTVMSPGDVLFFHGNLVHGSLPNSTTDRFRRSLIFHYVPTTSLEIAAFYSPLLTSSGAEVRIAAGEDGGPCGESFEIH